MAVAFSGAADLELALGSPGHFPSLNAVPARIGNGILGSPAMVVGGPPAGRYDGPLIAIRDTDEIVGLMSADRDGAHFTYPMGGVYGSSSPALAVWNGEVLLAFTEYTIYRNIVIGPWSDLFEIPPDLKDKIGQRCDPRACVDDPRLVCVTTGETELQNRPAEIQLARRGDIILTPADGSGVIGTILKSLDAPQFYDHMGLMVADNTTIRHCTEAKDRLMRDKDYFTGSLLGEKAPTDGLRPDLVKYGWPGPMTQSIQDGFFDGWNNGENPEWEYHGLAAAIGAGTAASLTPEQRQAFFDREFPEKAVRITNLTLSPAYRADAPDTLWPLRICPPPGTDSRYPWARWALDQVADEAQRTRGHYRFFAYSDARLANDPKRLAPPAGDPAWAGLPAGADWAAGTPGLVCSTFVWFAARHALDPLNPPLRLDRDPNLPQAAGAHGQVGPNQEDGLFVYHEAERQRSGAGLHDWIVDTVRATVKQQVDAQMTTLARVGIGMLVGVLTGAIVDRLRLRSSPS